MIEKKDTPAGQPDEADASAKAEDSGAPLAGAAEELDEPRVVYRRAEPIEASTQAPVSAPPTSGVWLREISPAIMPLIIGFLLLLILIAVLGLLSMRRMNEVGVAMLDLEQQHAAKLSLLLKLRLAVTKLDNEARARAEADARRELKPPLELRLNMAQDEVNDLLKQLQPPLLTSDPSWSSFHNDLAAYVEVTEDLRRYSLEGFDKFRVVDTELNNLLAQSTQEQVEIFHKGELI